MANPTIRQEQISSTPVRYSLPSSVTISVPSPNQRSFSRAAEKPRPTSSWGPPAALAGAGGAASAPLGSGDQVLVGHDLDDGVLSDPPPESRRSAVIRGSHRCPGCLPNKAATCAASACRRARRSKASPWRELVEPRWGHPQRQARGRVRHLVLALWVTMHAATAVGPSPQSTQRATERLRTSRCIRSSAFSFRSRASLARSSWLSG